MPRIGFPCGGRPQSELRLQWPEDRFHFRQRHMGPPQPFGIPVKDVGAQGMETGMAHHGTLPVSPVPGDGPGLPFLAVGFDGDVIMPGHPAIGLATARSGGGCSPAASSSREGKAWHQVPQGLPRNAGQCRIWGAPKGASPSWCRATRCCPAGWNYGGQGYGHQGPGQGAEGGIGTPFPGLSPSCLAAVPSKQVLVRSWSVIVGARSKRVRHLACRWSSMSVWLAYNLSAARWKAMSLILVKSISIISPMALLLLSHFPVLHSEPRDDIRPMMEARVRHFRCRLKPRTSRRAASPACSIPTVRWLLTTQALMLTLSKGVMPGPWSPAVAGSCRRAWWGNQRVPLSFGTGGASIPFRWRSVARG
ncbi:MAG: hypothetical protein OXC82_12940 [Rhodobacteraceae bacterium]|nr:hypothetical protein [Paracoccaceae bacterium]